MNPQKIKGPVTVIRFLGIIWLGKMHVVPEAVTDKAQEVKAFMVILEFGGLVFPTWHSASVPCTTW